jgi:RNA polymerase sigma-70 factor (ECF subfamily)
MNYKDEKNIICRAKANDQSAFNILFNMHWDKVYSVLYLRILNSKVAEELAIETFSKAFDRLESFDEKLSFISWILTIAKNHHIDRYRKSKQEFENLKEIDQDNYFEPYSCDPSPEDLMIANQNLDHILANIKTLKKEYQNIIKLRYFENLSYKEIENILEEPATTIRVKLFRAKKMLANLLDRETN